MCTSCVTQLLKFSKHFQNPMNSFFWTPNCLGVLRNWRGNFITIQAFFTCPSYKRNKSTFEKVWEFDESTFTLKWTKYLYIYHNPLSRTNLRYNYDININIRLRGYRHRSFSIINNKCWELIYYSLNSTYLMNEWGMSN